jgi:hypothetical protein
VEEYLIAYPGLRKEIVELARKPAYSMDAHRAAELLGVSVERIEVLASDGLIGSTYRRGALWVSSQDVSSMIATQQRNKKRCRIMDELMGIRAPETPDATV